VFATWAARIPALKADLGLTDSQLAIVLVGLNAGAVVGLQLGSVLVTRFGSRPVLLVALPAFAGALLPVGLAPDPTALTVAAALSAGTNSVVDVAINDQGVGVQHRYGRSLLTGMHAMHSLGGVLGGAGAALAAHAGLGVVCHFSIAAVAVATLAWFGNRTLLRPEQLHGDDAQRTRSTPVLTGWTGRLLALGAVAFVFTFAEGSALDWGAVLLADDRGASPALAAAGLAVFHAAVTIGRLLGDPIIDRIGPVRLFAAGSVLAGGGFAGGLLLGSTASALAGLAVLGIGLATLLPISISAAGTIRGLPVPVAVARVSTVGYLGTFTGPAVIGYLSHHTDLPTALLLPAIAVACTSIAAPVVRHRRSRAASPLVIDVGGVGGSTDQESSAASSVLVTLAPVEGSTTMTDARPRSADEADLVAAVRSDDPARFALVTERHRRELQVHCYRMLANYEDAQDLTQETFLRAWNKRESFRGNASPRTWLYRIATNACLDFLEKRDDRTPVPFDPSDPSGSELLYLQPYPDRMLPEDPQESVVARETIELAFIVAVQHLPPRQRAVLILRDVLGWPAPKTADVLGLTVASVTSALQRARVTMREQVPDRRLDWRSPATHELSSEERGVVRSYIDAHERNDLDGLMSLLREDLRFVMLPDRGSSSVTAQDAVDGWVSGGLFQRGHGDWRCIATTVNRMPAAALYLRTADEPVHRLFTMAVLHVVDGKIAELTGFDATDKPWLGLPPTL
jgi:RNA polymerase sigma-70 factor (ECF subfamily)